MLKISSDYFYPFCMVFDFFIKFVYSICLECLNVTL